MSYLAIGILILGLLGGVMSAAAGNYIVAIVLFATGAGIATLIQRKYMEDQNKASARTQGQLIHRLVTGMQPVTIPTRPDGFDLKKTDLGLGIRVWISPNTVNFRIYSLQGQIHPYLQGNLAVKLNDGQAQKVNLTLAEFENGSCLEGNMVYRGDGQLKFTQFDPRADKPVKKLAEAA